MNKQDIVQIVVVCVLVAAFLGCGVIPLFIRMARDLWQWALMP